MASEQLLQDHVAEIQAIGRRLASLKASREALYDAVRGLDHGTAQALKESNEKAAMAARPVNLVRYEILRRVLAGEEVDATGTERLQDAIVRREESAFPGYPEAFYQQLRAADIKANAFRNWKDHFRLFYSFFYSGEDRDRVPKVLDEICDGTKRELRLEDHGHVTTSVTHPAGWQFPPVKRLLTRLPTNSSWVLVRPV